ncbi:MAG: LPP20 family lipoprotein [Helicobacteraceae bacterium]|jgi:hypothetical protein|nr:LPP20 family lipoprotein [Helicobacteraceae bacterium]
MRFFYLILAALLIAGCGAKTPSSKTSGEPSWIKGNSGFSSAYLTGIGSGATQQVAADRARGDLAKAISVSVESAEQSRKTSSDTAYSAEFTSVVYARANRTLEGVEIAERYYDEKNDLYYALAVLDKRAAASRLASEISQTELEIDAILSRVSGSNAISRLKLLNNAETLVKERRAAEAIRSVLDGMGGKLFMSEADVKAKKAEAIKAISFSVSGDSEAQKLLRESLTAIGFTISPNGTFDAAGEFNLEMTKDDRYHWAKAKIDVRLTDRAKGETAMSAEFAAEESSQNKDAAKNRAIAALRKTLGQEILAKLGE